MWGRGPKGNNATCSALCQLSVTSATTHKQIGPFWCWFLGEWVCVCSRTLCVSPMNSPVRLGVSPTNSTPTSFSVRGFEDLFPRTRTLGCVGCLAPQLSLPVYLPMWDYLVCQPLPCHESSPHSCLSLPLLLVWMNVSSLTPWLSDFHIVQFSVSSGCFLFLNLLLFFSLCEVAECIHLWWKNSVVLCHF